MSPQQAQRHYHIGLTIERPAYYRPPRSRPVSFERPNSRNASPLWENRNKLEYHQDSIGQQTDRTMRAGQVQHAEMRLANLPSHNNTPKPFTREQPVYGEQFGRYSAETPKILVNDQAPYPTSTVHKSMMNRRTPVRESSEPGRSRSTTLLSPTTLTSYQSQGVGLDSVLPAHRISASGAGNLDSTSVRAYPISSQQQLHRQPLIGSQSPSGGANSALGQRKSAEPSDVNRSPVSSLQCLPRAPEAGQGIGARGHSSANLAAYPGLSGSTINTNTVLPDDKRAEYMWNRQMERVSIAHQTYRTLPIIQPKPKARHDLASGTYMRYVQDPSWEFAQLARQAPIERSRDYEQKIQLAGGRGEGIGVS